MLALLAQAFCGRDDTSAAAEAATAIDPHVDLSELRVEFAGCEAGERGANTCVLNESSALTLWIEGERVSRIAAAGQDVVPVHAEAVDEGWRYHLVIPSGADELGVERDGAAAWSLRLLPPQPQRILDEIIATLPKQHAAGRSPRVEAVLVQLEAKLASMAPTEKIAALRLGTVLSWDLGRDGAPYGRRALAAALDSNDAARVLDTANLLLHMVDESSAEASWVLDVETLYATNVEDGIRLARWELDAAHHALHVGEAGKGIAHLRDAEARARRLGLRDEELIASARLGVELATHGREAERAAAISRFLVRVQQSTAESACPDAANLANAAASLAYAKLTGASEVDPEPLLRIAIAKFETDPILCKPENNPDWHDAHALARVNFVLAAVIDERWDAVQERLAWFDGHSLVGNRRNSVILSRAELALERGQVADARRHLRGVAEAQELVEWRHQVLRGRIEERSNNAAAALDAYLAAERVVDQLAQGAGVEPARDGATVGIHRGAALAIMLLARSGRDAEAAEIARVSRARTLRPVGVAARVAFLTQHQRQQWSDSMREYDAARDRIAEELTSAWSLPTDEREAMFRTHEPLRAQMRSAHERAFDILAAAKAPRHALGKPRADETWLVFHPAPTGWLGVALSVEGAKVRKIDLEPGSATSETLGHALLDPFDAELASGRAVKVLAMGALLDVAFHDLSWRGQSLIEHTPVSWTVDFAFAAASPPGVTARASALVVADPTTFASGVGRLPHAGEEAATVATALGQRGWSVESLLGEGATLPSVLEQLRSADWLHYAGHGLAETASAWDAALPLAGEAQLTVRDILTGGRVPQTVVLSGCNTAATRSAGLSLATAFVLAGSRAVVGSTTELVDADARAMSEALYRHLDVPDPRAWVRAAILDGRARGAAWTTSVRLWTP